LTPHRPKGRGLSLIFINSREPFLDI